MQHFQQYIGGRFSNGSAQFESRNPATGEVWAMMPEARRQDVDAAVTAAEAMFYAPEWAGLAASKCTWQAVVAPCRPHCGKFGNTGTA